MTVKRPLVVLAALLVSVPLSLFGAEGLTSPPPPTAPPKTVTPALPGPSDAPQDAKAPLPDKTTIATLRRQLKDIFKAEYSKGDPESRKTFVNRLLSDAAGTADPNQVFVMLVEARDLAADVGNVHAAFEAIRRIESQFDVGLTDSEWAVFPQKLAVLDAARKVARNAEAREAVAAAYLALAGEAMQGDCYETGLEAANGAERLSSYAGNRDLSKQARELVKEVTLLAREQKASREAEQRLSVNPDDPKANLVVGRFTCFVKGDWEHGIPCLAKGEDPELAGLAKRELAAPKTAKERSELGDAWMALSRKEWDDSWKRRYQHRARTWYVQALEDSDGFLKLALEKKLGELPSGGGESAIGLVKSWEGTWTLKAWGGLYGFFPERDGSGTIKILKHEKPLKRGKTSPFTWKVEKGRLLIAGKHGPFSIVLPLNPKGSPVFRNSEECGVLVKSEPRKDKED